MGIQIKSLLSALALVLALLAFGPATSSAQAAHLVRHGSFHGPAVHRSFSPIRHRASGFVRPSHRFAPRVGFGFARPYRLVRVFVYDPFPRWVYRRVYDAPYGGAYCPY